MCHVQTADARAWALVRLAVVSAGGETTRSFSAVSLPLALLSRKTGLPVPEERVVATNPPRGSPTTLFHSQQRLCQKQPFAHA